VPAQLGQHDPERIDADAPQQGQAFLDFRLLAADETMLLKAFRVLATCMDRWKTTPTERACI
jgi:hypothetical protein